MFGGQKTLERSITYAVYIFTVKILFRHNISFRKAEGVPRKVILAERDLAMVCSSNTQDSNTLLCACL